MPLRIREAETKDAEAVARVHICAWQAAYRGQLSDDYLDGLSVDERLPNTRAMIEGATADLRVWVAEDEDGVVGFAVTAPSEDADADRKTGELYAIYLQPERVGTGLGRSLLEHAIGDLRSRGFQTATLWVLETNEQARRFYEIAGWKPDGTTTSERVDCEMRPTMRYRIGLV
jgi:GNAT superfamily N-acetyltransferase